MYSSTDKGVELEDLNGNGELNLPDEKRKRSEFDEFLEKVGEFGLSQKIQMFLLCLVPIATAWHNMGMVFFGGFPQHHCHVDAPVNQSKEEVLNYSIPWEEKNNKWQYSECNIYDRNITDPWLVNDTTTIPCTEWDYDKSVFTNTVVNEWNMVCDQKWLIASSQSLYMFGYFVGCIVVGDLSDRFGRRLTLVLCSVVQMVFGIGAAFSPNFIVFTCLRFVIGMATGGQRNSSYCLMQEWCTQHYRTLAGIGSQLGWATGYVTLGGIAYFIRNWRMLEIVTSAPMLFFVLYHWFTWRSPRWLIAKGREEEALDIFEKVGKRNGKPLEADFKLHPATTKGVRTSLLDPLRTRNMRLVTLLVWLNWFVVGMIFFGISFNAGNLAGDFYLNSTILGAVELVGYIPVYWIMKLGRRLPLAFIMMFSGVSCLLVMAVPKDLSVVTTVLATFGKAGSSAVFAIIYVYTSEVYPTGIRNIGLGTGSMCARVGGMVAPYIALLGDIESTLPFIIFGVSGIVTGILTILLPETLGRPLVDTLEEAEEINTLSCRCRNRSEKYINDDVKNEA